MLGVKLFQVWCCDSLPNLHMLYFKNLGFTGGCFIMTEFATLRSLSRGQISNSGLPWVKKEVLGRTNLPAFPSCNLLKTLNLF
jgi:hypothetical protein